MCGISVAMSAGQVPRVHISLFIAIEPVGVPYLARVKLSQYGLQYSSLQGPWIQAGIVHLPPQTANCRLVLTVLVHTYPYLPPTVNRHRKTLRSMMLFAWEQPAGSFVCADQGPGKHQASHRTAGTGRQPKPTISPPSAPKHLACTDNSTRNPRE